jgi:hypothetical protein
LFLACISNELKGYWVSWVALLIANEFSPEYRRAQHIRWLPSDIDAGGPRRADIIAVTNYDGL